MLGLRNIRNNAPNIFNLYCNFIFFFFRSKFCVWDSNEWCWILPVVSLLPIGWFHWPPDFSWKRETHLTQQKQDWHNSVLLLVQYCRRCTTSERTLVQRLVSAHFFSEYLFLILNVWIFSLHLKLKIAMKSLKEKWPHQLKVKCLASRCKWLTQDAHIYLHKMFSIFFCSWMVVWHETSRYKIDC